MQRTPLDAWIGEKIGAGAFWTGKELRAWQLHKLNETLVWVRQRSRFYMAHLVELPDQLDSLEQLAQFPFTTAEDIRKNPLQFVCVSQDEINRVVTLQTSGTSGDPKRLFFTKADQALTIDFFATGMSTLVGEEERVMICLPGLTPGSVGDLLRTGLERIGAKPLPFGSVDVLDECREFIREHQPHCIVGSPLQMLGLARRWPPDLLPPKKLLLSTDTLTHAVAEALKETWQCEIFDHYGSTEMGLGGGVACKAHQGMHMREADMLFEIIDPQTGTVLPPGETGEVVFTTITRTGMPLIRYRMGDWSRILPGKCACCSTVLRLANPQGRLSNDWLVNERRVGLKELDEIFLSIPEVLDVLYSTGGNLFQVKLVLVQEPNGDHYRQAIMEAESLIGSEIQVVVEICPEYMAGLAKRSIKRL